MQSNNHPAAPDSFENSRLVDLIEQRSALFVRVRALHPALVNDQEGDALSLLIDSMAEARKETQGL